MKTYLKTKDYSVSGEDFSLIHDLDLDMLKTHPQPKSLETYYQSETYISHTDAAITFTDKLYQLVKKINLKNKLKLMGARSQASKSVLDIGAGTGDFLAYAKIHGWNITGVEPNASAREKALEKGITLFETLGDLSMNSYNTITLWHVLEHIPNLELELNNIIQLLVKDGLLIIAVPNFKSFDAKYYAQHWAAFDVPRHLWHFSKNAITQLLEERGMQLVKIKPMWFDAFYVSLLSEKYKTGKQNLIKAFFVGLYSNCKGIFSKEYSSQIYIFKKQ